MVWPLSDRRVMVRCGLFVIALFAAACRGEARQTSANDATLARMVDSLRAPVERAVGLVFTSPPRSAMRTKEQVRGYLIRKLDEELPPARLRGLETTYRLFGLLPDTLHLRPLLLDLYRSRSPVSTTPTRRRCSASRGPIRSGCGSSSPTR